MSAVRESEFDPPAAVVEALEAAFLSRADHVRVALYCLEQAGMPFEQRKKIAERSMAFLDIDDEVSP